MIEQTTTKLNELREKKRIGLLLSGGSEAHSSHSHFSSPDSESEFVEDLANEISGKYHCTVMSSKEVFCFFPEVPK